MSFCLCFSWLMSLSSLCCFVFVSLSLFLSTHFPVTFSLSFSRITGALVLLSPLIAGTFFGVNAVFGLLTGSLLSGVQLAISMSNTGMAGFGTVLRSTCSPLSYTLHLSIHKHLLLLSITTSHTYCHLLPPPSTSPTPSTTFYLPRRCLGQC